MGSNLKAIGWLTGLKVAGAVAGLLYAVLRVRYFGAARDIEVFFAAQSIVYLVSSLTQSGQLSEVFLPVYVQLREQVSRRAAQAALSVTLNRLLLFVVAFGVVAYFAAPWVMRAFVPGFPPPDQASATTIFRALLPLIGLTVLGSFINTSLNAERVFGRVEATALANSVLSTVFLIAFYDRLGVWVLVCALYVGKAIELLIAAVFLRKQEYRHTWALAAEGFEHGDFFRTVYATGGYTLGTQLLNWSMTASLSLLPAGLLAVYNHVQRLLPKINAVLAKPVSTVFFTHINERVHAGDAPSDIRVEVGTYVRAALVVGAGVFVIAAAAGPTALRALWGSASMSDAEFGYAGVFFTGLMLAFAFQIFHSIYRRYSIALGLASRNYVWATVLQFISAGLVFLLATSFGPLGFLAGVLLNKFSHSAIAPLLVAQRSPDYANVGGIGFWTRYVITLAIGGGLAVAARAPVSAWLQAVNVAVVPESVVVTVVLAVLSATLFVLLAAPLGLLPKLGAFQRASRR